MRKSIALFLIALVSFTFVESTYAQAGVPTLEEVSKAGMQADGKYAIMVDNAGYFMAAAITGEMYRSFSKELDYQIILIGDVVKELADNKELHAVAAKAHELGVNIVACQFAMKKYGVTSDQYPEFIQETANAFQYYYGLKALGYLTLAP